MSSIQNIKFKAEDISKSFFRDNYLFSGINIELLPGDSLAITGRNGSGKSTLMKILAGLMLSSSGNTEFSINNTKLKEDQVPGNISFVAPYANLYEEFTPLEIAQIYCGLNGRKFEKSNFLILCEEFDLSNHTKKIIKNFSSGMKQRLKLIIGFLNDPPFLFLDEPGSNLDEYGLKTAIEIAGTRNTKGRITFIASNDSREIVNCNKTIEVQ